MGTALWIVQILLAVFFLFAGFTKLTQPIAKLASTNMKWAGSFPPLVVRAIGVLEILAAIGLVAPAATGILPVLTPLAAVGLILTMTGAIATHVSRGEFPILGMNLVLLALAAFVAYGRLVLVPFTA